MGTGAPTTENAAPPAEQSADQILGLGPEAAAPAGPAAPQITQPPVQSAAPAAAPAATEQPSSPWTPEELAEYPELAKFKTRAELAKSYRGLERTFHGFHEANLDPETTLRALTADRGEAPPAEGAPEAETPPEDPLDTPVGFLDAFATQPRQLFRSEFRSMFREAMRNFATAQTVSKSLFDAAVSDPAMPEFAAKNDEMGALLDKHPELLSKHEPAEVMRLLYRMVGGKTAPAKEQVDEITERARAEVRDTMVESGRAGSAVPGTTRDAGIADDIVAGSGAAQPVMRPV